MTTDTLDRVEVNGLKFYVRPGTSDQKSINEVVARRSYARYHFVPAEGEFWIDLGSNIGAFSVWAASQHPSIRVHAYEPDPTMCELIELNVRLNGLSDQVQVFQSAVVADSRKAVTLHLNSARGNVWRSSIERSWRGGEDIVVPTYHIRNVLKAVPDGSYLKMDIEGTEMKLLEWMTNESNGQARALVKRKLRGMVFEWSFDVDPDIDRLRRVTEALRGRYDDVRSPGIPADAKVWQPQWFPPCRLIWAWNV